MGGNQNKQKLKYANIQNRELAVKGFEKLIKAQFSHSNSNKNINEQNDSVDIIYKSQLNEELESDESILFVYKLFLSMINNANNNLLCNNIYSSLLANQIVEYEQDNMNESTKRFKQDYQATVNNLTKELLECKDNQEQNHNFLLQLSKTFTSTSILLKNEDSSRLKTGGSLKKELGNNNISNKGICVTNNSKKNGIAKEQLEATINPNKLKTTVYYPTTDIDKYIDDKNRESFSTAREELEDPKSYYDTHKEVAITSPKAKGNNLYKTLVFKGNKPNKTLKIPKKEMLKTKSLKSPQNLTSISNKPNKKTSSTLFRIDIKDLIKQSNQSTNNTIDNEDDNRSEQRSTLNMTFVECIDKFLGIDKSYLNKKKQLNLVPKKIKKTNFNQYSYFNKSITQNQSAITPYKRPPIVKKKNPKSSVDSLLYSTNNHITNKITEESISNTINYGNYMSTISKQNKSNEVSNRKENNQNEENKNNFFNNPNYLVEDILKDNNIQLYYNNSNLLEQAKHIPTVKESETKSKYNSHNNDKVSHAQKDENEINLTDSEEYFSAISSYPSEDLRKEKSHNEISNIS